MSSDFEDEVLPEVDEGRRGFIRKIAVGTAFAAPVVASFDMTGLTFGTAANAGPNGSNLTVPRGPSAG